MEELTAIVVGAGASVPYGLPTGPNLTNHAIKFLTEHSKSDWNDDLERRIDLDDFAKVAAMIRRSRTPTIDHYMGRNPKYGSSIKLAIAGALWELEAKALDPSTIPDDDWISWLYHNICDGHPSRFCNNKLAFVSFNYDRLPLAIMSTMMANTFDIDCAQAMRICQDASKLDIPELDNRFIHIHGSLASPMSHHSPDHGRTVDRYRLSNRFSETVSGHPQKLDSLAQAIKTIHESDGENKAAVEVLWNATRVVFLGFGYHDLNMKKIGFSGIDIERLTKKARIGGTAFGVRGFARDQLQGRLGENFALGDPDEGCVEFLSRFLS